jgi:hypothetical protein
VNLWVLWKDGNFLTSNVDTSFSTPSEGTRDPLFCLFDSMILWKICEVKNVLLVFMPVSRTV